MPSVKRTGVKAEEKKTGFESYDGPEPTKRGMYRGKITQLNFCEFKSGAQGFKVLLELEAQAGDPKGHKQYDGYPLWTNIVFSDKEQMIIRENNFYAAIGTKDEPAIVFAEGDLTGQGQKVKTVGGKNPIGLYVNADIKLSTQAGYEGNPEVDGIYKLKDGGKSTGPTKAVSVATDEDDESDMMEEEEASEEEAEEAEGEEGEQTIEERLVDLNAATLAELKALAAEYELDVKPVTKKNLVNAISEYEFAEPGEDEEAEEEEEEEPSEEVEEEEEAEEEEEEADERAEREAALAAEDRTALKVIIKGLEPDFKVFKTTSDDDLRAAILVAEFGEQDETPF